MQRFQRIARAALALAILGVLVTAVGVAACSPKPAPSSRAPVGTASVPMSTSVPAATATAPLGPPATTEVVPEDTVDAFYDAAASGDYPGVQKTLADGVSLDKSLLASWGDPKHAIKLVQAGEKQGELWVEVDESAGGLPGDTVTFTLALQDDGAWLIKGWDKGDVTKQPGFGKGAVINPQLSRAEQHSVEALGKFLESRMMGDVSRMRKFATTHMERAHASMFKMQFGNFRSYAILDVRTEGGRWVLSAKEKWKSGTRTQIYEVVKQDGKYRVDELR